MSDEYKIGSTADSFETSELLCLYVILYCYLSCVVLHEACNKRCGFQVINFAENLIP